MLTQANAVLREYSDAALAAPELTLTAADVAAGDVARLQAQASETYGPVLRGNVPFGPDAGPCLYLVGPEIAETAMSTRVSAFSSDQGWRYVLGHGCGRAVLNTDDPLHAEQRRTWAPAMTGTMIQAHWPALTRTIAECIAPLRDGIELDAYPRLRALAFRAIARTIVGLPEEAIDPAFRAICVVLDGQDYTHESRSSYVERADIARAELAAILREVIATRRRHAANEGNTLLELLLAYPHFGSVVDADDEIRSHLTIVLIAGHDTGASFFSRAVFLLAELPEVAELLANELSAAGWRASSPLPTAELDRLPHLQRFLLEVSRLYPPLINLPRVVVEEIDIGDYRVVPGTRVAIAAAATHLLSRLHVNPLVFDLSRYADLDNVRVTQPFQMLAFAGGSRMCMGVRFAQLEFKSIVAHVVSQIRLERATERPVAHAGFWNARPAGPLLVRTHPR
jgi:cytochrome P450